MKHRNFHLIHAINSAPMHISKASANAYFPQVVKLMTTDLKSFYDDDFEESEEQKKENRQRYLSQFSAFTTTPYVESWYYSYPPVLLNDDVLVINIQGAIMKDDYCGNAGTKTIMSWYELAKKDTKIKGIIELCDSGGGAVLGTKELADYKLTYPKPTVSLTEGMRCSAMDLIACASAWLMATSENCIVGSIGVMTTYVDYTNYYKEMGIDVQDIYSKTSPLKNNAHRLAKEGDFSGLTDGILFKLDTNFMDFEKAQRPNISKEALQGADFTAIEAMNHGIMDQIGTLEDAYAKVLELSADTNNLTPNKYVQMAKKQRTVSSLMSHIKEFFADAEEVTDETENSEEEQAEETQEEDNSGAGETEEAEAEDKDAIIAELNAKLAKAEAKGNQMPAKAPTRVLPVGNQEKSPIATDKKDWTKSKAEHVAKARALGLLS